MWSAAPEGRASTQAEREAGLRRIAERQALVREVLDSAPLAGAEAPSRCGLPSRSIADAAWPAPGHHGRRLGVQVDLRRVAAQLGRLGDAGPHRQHAAAVRARRRQSRQPARRAPAAWLCVQRQPYIVRLTLIRRCAADAKRVSVSAWQRLQAACGGGPELAGGDVCRACVAARLQGVADAGQDSEERQAVLAILDALDADGAAGAAAGGFFVSRSWLACALLSTLAMLGRHSQCRSQYA